jgi:hypothetical protein
MAISPHEFNKHKGKKMGYGALPLWKRTSRPLRCAYTY